MKNTNCILSLIVMLLLIIGCGSAAPNKFFIRLNQVGYLPDDYKGGVVISEEDISGKTFRVIDASNKAVLSKRIGKSFGKYGQL